MSKVSAEVLTDAIAAVLNYSNVEKKRNFLETIELQIALKNYDPQKDKRFSGTVNVPHQPRPRFSVCVIADAKAVTECKEKEIEYKAEADLKVMKKNKKLVKKLCNMYDAFLASGTLIRKIPRLVGPGMNKAGKFPTLITAGESLENQIANRKRTIKFQLKSKKTLCLAVAIANVSHTPEEIEANITLALNYAVSLLPKTWQQVKKVTIKSTMGPGQCVYGF
jgi:large subunit ribosomal protein L10Ae